jgi:hypothetical protein
VGMDEKKETTERAVEIDVLSVLHEQLQLLRELQKSAVGLDKLTISKEITELVQIIIRCSNVIDYKNQRNARKTIDSV